MAHRFPLALAERLLSARSSCLCVVRTFVGELSRSLKKRAKRELGLASLKDAHTGAVCAVQRTDGALRLNVHLRVLCLDGVYVRPTESGALTYGTSLRENREVFGFSGVVARLGESGRP